jgi:hypothetical protein
MKRRPALSSIPLSSDPNPSPAPLTDLVKAAIGQAMGNHRGLLDTKA